MNVRACCLAMSGGMEGIRSVPTGGEYLAMNVKQINQLLAVKLEE